MVLFVAIIIRNLGEVLFRALRLCVIGSCITSSSKGTGVGVSLFVFFLLKPLFGLLLSIFGKFYIAKRIICKLGVLGFWLRLFDSRVLHDNVLNLYLDYSNVSGIIALLSSIVHLPDVGSKLKACFSLSLNQFLNHFFLGNPVLDSSILLGPL